MGRPTGIEPATTRTTTEGSTTELRSPYHLEKDGFRIAIVYRFMVALVKFFYPQRSDKSVRNQLQIQK